MRKQLDIARRRVALGLSLGLVLLASGALASDSFRAKMEQWVETKQLVSQEKSDWDADRETLRATRKLLAQQRDFLSAEIAKLEASSSEADDERRVLLLDRGRFQRNNARLEEELARLEKSLLELSAQFPAPLKKKLEPLLVQIPATPEAEPAKLGPRLMVVLGILAQADKFNSTATFVGETREVGDQRLQVRTLYWGLAQAIYVDSLGNTAGVGRPSLRDSAEGWEFTNEPELARSAQLLLDIYEGNVDTIDFIAFPVEVR